MSLACPKEAAVKIRFTLAQMQPVAKILKRQQRQGAKWCPKGVTPERWAKIVAGKAAHIECGAEFGAIVNVLGWDALSRVIKTNPKRKPTSKK
jgi:hypothetical protein